MAVADLLVQAGVMFGVLAVAGAVATRLGQSMIPFYVAGGAVVSEFVLGARGFPATPAPEFVAVLAELGIVFLLFFLGLEFSLDRLVAGRERMARVGLLDLAINLPLGVLVGLVLGWSLLESFVLGGIVYVSSSAIITKVLLDSGWIANAESEPILATLVFEDLFVGIYLAVISALLLGGETPTEIVSDVGTALAFLTVLLLAVWVGGGLFERLLRVDSNELFVLRAIAVTVLVAGAGLAAGVSEAVAAFFVGMGFSGTVHVETIEELLAPIRDVFAAVFFFWIGLTTDPLVVIGVGGLVVLVVAVTGPPKLLSGYLGGRIYGLDTRRSLRVGAGMVTRGEFSLVIAALAATTGTGPVLTQIIPALAVGYVLVMSVIGTTLVHRVDRVAPWMEGLLGDGSAPVE